MPTSPESELLAALLVDAEPLARGMVDRIRDEIPGFGSISYEEQLLDTVASVEWFARFALERPQPSPDLGRLRELGRRRAEQGVSVDDLIRSWRLAVSVGTTRARELAAALGLPAELVLEVFEETLRAADEALVPLVDSHREAMMRFAGDAGERFVVAALRGELEPEQLRAQAAVHGLDLTRAYRAVRVPVDTAERRRAIAAAIERAGGLSSIRDGDLIGLLSGELERGRADLVAIGPSGPIEELPASYAAAGRILGAARSHGLAGVHDMTSAALFVTVFESGDAGDALIDRYVRPLDAASSGADLLATVRTWLDSGMRVEPAAERLHIHANTLRYRLGRYAALTGADLSDTEEIVSIWLALSRQLATGA